MSNEIKFGDDIEYMSFSFTPLIDGKSQYKDKVTGNTLFSTGDRVTVANINPTKARKSALGSVPFGIGLYIHEQQMLHRSAGLEMQFWLNIRTKSGDTITTPVSNEEAGDLLNV